MLVESDQRKINLERHHLYDSKTKEKQYSNESPRSYSGLDLIWEEF
jgi:hypothetical protein